MSAVGTSMAWMRQPGQTSLSAVAWFLAAWLAMMVAMMLPSLIPVLLRFRRNVVGASGARRGVLTAVVASGYFFLWTMLGVVAYSAGLGLTLLEIRVPPVVRIVSICVGLIVLFAGALQFTAWKAQRLDCCRKELRCNRAQLANIGAAWLHGLHIGLRCCYCCGALMGALVVTGMMSVPLVAAVTAAITLERLAPNGIRTARAIGAVVIAGGLLLVVRAAGVG